MAKRQPTRRQTRTALLLGLPLDPAAQGAINGAKLQRLTGKRTARAKAETDPPPAWISGEEPERFEQLKLFD